MINNIKKTRGFSLVEIILTSSILGLLAMAFAGLMSVGEETSVQSGNRVRAIFFAEEGLEAARNLRDGNFTNLTDGAHGLSATSGAWAFASSSDTDGFYTRTVNIASLDANRKIATSTVSWNQSSKRPGQISLTSIFSNWAASGGIGNWASPTQKSIKDLLGTTAAIRVKVQGNYAYVITSATTNNFAIINTTDPTVPVITATMTLLGGAPQDITVSGSYAYVTTANTAQELQIVNIGNPYAPVIAGTYNAVGTNAAFSGIDNFGTTLYIGRLTSTNPDFYIINAANPSTATLSLVGTVELGGSGLAVKMMGNYAYVASSHNSRELQVIDISNPPTAFLAAYKDLTIGTTSDALCIDGFGDYVLLCQGNYLNIVNIANPVVPVISSTYNFRALAYGVSIGNAGSYAWTASASTTAEMRVIDYSAPLTPTSLGFYNAAGNLRGIDYDNSRDLAFAATAVTTGEFVIYGPQ